VARPSKLTDKQWESIGKRLLNGESAASLARSFGISKAAVSLRFSKRIETVKSVANQIVATGKALELLNVSEQIAAHDMASRMRSISGHLMGAADYGAATAHRLSGIAHAKVQEIDDAAPVSEESLNALKGINALTRMANDASSIGLNLIAANKDAVNKLQNPPKGPSGLSHFYGESD